MAEPLHLLGVADLVSRWGYTRQGVHKLAGADDFPAPAAVVNQGRTRIWRIEDIQAFEATHPEVRSEGAKLRKVRGFFLATLKDGDQGD